VGPASEARRKLHRVTFRLALAVLVAAAPVLGPTGPSAAHAATACREPLSIRMAGSTVRYRVKVERRAVSCTTARTVLRTFIATKQARRGWACFRGHSSNRWAAACSRKTAMVRAYALR
jgi:hypothetical protein